MYGWSTNSQVYHNGVCQGIIRNQKTEVEINDIIEFLIDCDTRKIRFKNEQKQLTYELDIDLNMCPFPWQMGLDVYHANTSLRLLQ